MSDNQILRNTLSHRRNFLVSGGLSDQDLRQLVPSAFAQSPSRRVSDMYRFIPTTDSIELLRDSNWYPVNAFQQNCKTQDRIGFTKHVIVFRNPDFKTLSGDEHPELIIENSHNTSASYKIHAGIFRAICSNGLIVADESFASLKIRHAGIVDQVIEGTRNVASNVPVVFSQMNRMKKRILSPIESLDFAYRALSLRYDKVENIAIEPETILHRRRSQDKSMSLWHHLNVVQENLIKGGVKSRIKKPNKISAVIQVRSLSKQIELNKGLWKLAERMLN